MENLILSQIPLSEIIEQVRKAVREEIAAAGISGDKGNEKPVTQNELCKFLGVTAQTVIRWKKKGKIPFYTVGNAIRFDLNKVVKALEK